MPYKDPEKRKMAARKSMKRKRGSNNEGENVNPETIVNPCEPRGDGIEVPELSFGVSSALMKVIRGLVQEMVTTANEDSAAEISVIQETLADQDADIKELKELVSGLEKRGMITVKPWRGGRAI